VMAADLQEPPELILRFREALREDGCDVVIGTRDGRADPFGKRLSSSIFWSVYRRFIQRSMPEGGIDVFGCNRAFRDRLLELRELNTTLVGLIVWMGFRRAAVPYARRERRHGKSAWSFRRRVRYLLDSCFAFSDLPIRLVSVCGALGLAISIVLGLTLIVLKLSGRIDVPGYTATVVTVMFFGGLNAMGIGLIGEYVWRTFENTKGRPSYFVARHVEFSPGAVTTHERT
jgi:polyisoprenyl-phosphate glycosyltransferase